MPGPPRRPGHERDRQRVEQRRARVPAISYPDSLPVSARIAEIRDAIAAHPVIVVCGETGSGKTTQLPKACLEAGRGLQGMIGHTQPRRIAARTVAARLAEELQVELGAQVGYKVRLAELGSSDSLVRVMTDGILLAETHGDPELRRYDTLIIDEAHERSLNIDFLLGYLKQLLPRRPDLRLIITSATIDPQRFADFFGGAPVIEVSGRGWPIELRWRPLAADEDDDLDPGLVPGICDAVGELVADRATAGGILVFLPGEREIRETADALRGRFPGTEILPLYSRLSWPEQQRVFSDGGRRRVVLATNVAETSITVPGIRAVVDSGLARIARYSPRSKILRLPVEPVSRASADQRMGRCGRVGPGVCVRLYDEAGFEAREAFTPPEILRTNLARVILQMEVLGLGRIDRFPFVDPPDTRYVNDGYRLLRELQAVDEEQRLTETGRTMARLPVDPTLARMLIEARRFGCLSELLTLVALLSIQDPRERPAGQQAEADERHRAFADPKSDFVAMLNLWQAWREVRRSRSGNQARRWCREQFLSALRMYEWEELRGQLAQLAGELGWRQNDAPAGYEALHRALLPGLLGGIGERSERGDFLGARGLRFALAPGTPLRDRPPRWVMAAQLVETRRVWARQVAAVEPGWIEAAAAHLVRRSYDEPAWSAERGMVAARETVTLYGLTLSAGRRVNYGRIDPAAARRVFLREGLLLGRCRLRAGFLAHNRRVRAELEQLEARLRRPGALFDEERALEFLAAGVPESVHDLRGFERWRKENRDGQRDPLRFSIEDVLVPGARRPDPREFPAGLAVAGRELPLRYRLEPGAPDDGATLELPLPLLAAPDAEQLAWGVPGWRQELVTELIRGLPKPLRRRLVPAPATAEAFLTEVAAAGPLYPTLAAWLGRRAGEPVPEEQLRAVGLPDWLRLNYRVLADDGRALGEGRDLAALRASLADEFRRSQREAAGSLAQTGLRCWEVGTLADSIDVAQAGATLRMYPALEDRGDTVALTAFADEAEAQRRHRAGVRRLLAIALADPLKHARRAMAADRELALLLQSWGPLESLAGQVCDRAVERSCLPDGTPLPRDASAFEAAAETGRPEIYDTAMGVCAIAKAALSAARDLQRALAALPAGADTALAEDCRRQLERLAGPDFVAATPDPWLDQLPRLLAGLQARVERLRTGRQAREQQELLRWHRRLEAGEGDAELRWLLAEYCVSLFAQQLGTSQPVSAQRLERRYGAPAARAGR